MDIIVDQNKPLLSLNKLYEIDEQFGIKSEAIDEMLKFYNKTGTIVYFGKEMTSGDW